MLKTPITFCNFFFIWFTSFQRKCNQNKKDNSTQIVNSPFLVKIKRSKLVIFKLPLSNCFNIIFCFAVSAYFLLYFQAPILFLEPYMLYGSFFLSTSAFWNSSFLTINHLFKNSIVVIHVLQS